MLKYENVILPPYTRYLPPKIPLQKTQLVYVELVYIHDVHVVSADERKDVILILDTKNAKTKFMKRMLVGMKIKKLTRECSYMYKGNVIVVVIFITRIYLFAIKQGEIK